MDYNKQSTIINLFRENIPLLQSIGDPIRQDIILILRERGELNVNMITSLTKISRPAISHHLKILKDVGIVQMKKKGKENLYYLHGAQTFKRLKLLIDLVLQECEDTQYTQKYEGGDMK